MIVDKLETGYSDSAIYSAWWPGSGPVQVAEVQRWSSEYVNGDDLTTLSQSVSTRHSRPLTHAVLTVENERSMTERHERVCNPDNASDCCRRISSSTTLNEVWELELEGDDGPRLRRSGAAPFSESHSKGCEALAPQ